MLYIDTSLKICSDVKLPIGRPQKSIVEFDFTCLFWTASVD